MSNPQPRRVEVAKNVLDNKGRPTGDRVKDYEATFECWSMDSEEIDMGALISPVAIVVRDDGQTEIIYADFIKFIGKDRKFYAIDS